MADEGIIRVTKLTKITYSRWKIEIRNALESHRTWEIADGIAIKPEKERNDDRTKPDSTVGTFVAGLKVITRRIEELESEDFGRSFNEKLLMAKILGCLPKEFDNFVTSWSLLSESVSLENIWEMESFLKKLTNTERSFADNTDDISHEVFKAQSKSTSRQVKKAIDKKFESKCHKCDKKEHIQRDYSGASIHLTRNIEWFSSLCKLTSPIVLNVADDKTLRTTHIGNIEIEKSIDYAEQETKRKAVSLRTDKGTEYVNENVREVLKSIGITHELSPLNVKQYLSRMDCHLLWTEVIGTAAYFRNRMPNRGIMSTIPYFEWYGNRMFLIFKFSVQKFLYIFLTQ
ncbi:hypothetical protein ACFW04_007410 [Cataglyphis niger]